MDDDKIPSNFDTQLSYASPGMTVGVTENGLPMGPIVPPEPKVDYTALSEAAVYDLLSENGAVRELNVNISMIDDKNGTGKATATIGKDIKKRKFEIPISIKDGSVHLGKAIDLDTGKTVDVSKSSKVMFEAPGKETMDAQLLKAYEKHLDFFSGKPNDIKVKGLMSRFPSLTSEEAKLFLDEQYYSNRGKFFSSVDKVTDSVKKNKKNILLFGVGATAAILIYVYMKRNRKTTEQGTQVEAQGEPLVQSF